MEVVRSKGQCMYLLQSIENGARIDGRNLTEHRPILMEHGILRTAEGSSRVLLGRTELFVAVNSEIVEVDDSNAEEKILNFTVKVAPQGPNSQLFEQDDRDLVDDFDREAFFQIGRETFKEEIETSMTSMEVLSKIRQKINKDIAEESEHSVTGEIERTLDKIFNRLSDLNFSNLVISRNHMWNIEVEIMVVKYAGNLLEAAYLGAKAALNDFRCIQPPVTHDAESDKDVISAIDEDGLAQIGSWRFDIEKVPLFGVSYKIGDNAVLDINEYEGMLRPLTFWVVIEKPGSQRVIDDDCDVLCSQQSGVGGVRTDVHREMVTNAIRSARQLDATLVSYLQRWTTEETDPYRISHLCFNNVFSGNKQHIVSNLFQADESSKRHGGELVADVLFAHNVKEIFVLCGGHISPILVAAEKLGIKIIDTRHEVNAVFAADAVARLRQTIGVAAVTAGPGLTNTITAVKNAQMAESPLLLIGGASPTLLKGRGALQDIDQMALFRPLCKYTARVTRLRDIIPTVREAIRAASSGCPGPVFVEFPVDVLYPYELVMREVGLNPNAKGFVQQALNHYLRIHVSRQFGAAWIPQELTPLPTNIAKPSSEQIDSIASLIRTAKRPVMLIGSQATLPPIKPTDLVKAVENLGIPVFLGGMTRGLLGKNNELQMRQCRKDALKEADLTILAGTVCDFRLSYGRVLSKKSKIVVINRNRDQLTKNEKAFWNADVSVQADVASTLVSVANALKNQISRQKDWIASLRKLDNTKEEANDKKAIEKPKNGGINPLSFLKAFDKVLPDDAILVADGGDFVGSAAYVVRPRGPLQWLDPGAFGTLGVGGGFALGAKTVYPNKPVYIIWGDGSCGYSLMEYDTFARFKLGVVSVIGNDACWSQIAREQVPMFGTAVSTQLAPTPYEKVAEALGGWGAAITDKNEDETEEILGSAAAKSKQGVPALVNVHIGKSDFREGSISV
ncbi:unnamed protein product, partial [Mesorhabditis belari]|uniref:2-hydroxyacyl-CoA lyase 2 n=1 Tax=Mesorhabditis belari TaxID=2138241 RepID=A0AAF3FEF5_9BILA